MDEQRPKGRPKLTWLALMKQNLAKHEISWKRAKELAQDRVWWRSFKWRITADDEPCSGISTSLATGSRPGPLSRRS